MGTNVAQTGWLWHVQTSVGDPSPTCSVVCLLPACRFALAVRPLAFASSSLHLFNAFLLGFVVPPRPVTLVELSCSLRSANSTEANFCFVFSYYCSKSKLQSLRYRDPLVRVKIFFKGNIKSLPAHLPYLGLTKRTPHRDEV